MNKRILAIGAHPDDIEQFIGGTLLLLKQHGYKIKFFILTDGACGSMTLSDKEIIDVRSKEMKTGAKLIGAELETAGIRDGSLEYNLITTKRIIKTIREYNPGITFTHPTVDYMTDHAHAGQLVLWAMTEAEHPNFIVDSKAPPITERPFVYHTDPQGLIGPDGQIVRVNTIVDITTTIDKKLKAFASHKSQMSFLKVGTHEISSVEKTRRWAITRGQMARIPFGEGFTQQLLEQYPRQNILKEILKEKVYTL